MWNKPSRSHLRCHAGYTKHWVSVLENFPGTLYPVFNKKGFAASLIKTVLAAFVEISLLAIFCFKALFLHLSIHTSFAVYV